MNALYLNKERIKLQTELDLILADGAEQLLLRSLGLVYEHWGKAGRLLAHKLKVKSASNTQEIDKTGMVTSDPYKINNTFKSFWHKIQVPEYDNSQFNIFFWELDLPQVLPCDNLRLDTVITLQIKEAI